MNYCLGMGLNITLFQLTKASQLRAKLINTDFSKNYNITNYYEFMYYFIWAIIRRGDH